MSAREFSGKIVRIEGRKQKVPKFSEWEQKCDCCGCKLAYFPEIDKYFCNQWECNWKQPSIVLAVVIISFVFGMWAIIDIFSGLSRILFLVFLSLFFIFWIISFFCAMCRSPGYLPWYWAVQKGTQYTYEEQMDGVITTDAQYNFAYNFSKPERGTLTRKGRRIILRADHICPWISNWVGLKNYRYFFTKLMWTVVMFIIWFVLLGFVIANIVKEGWKTNVTNIAMLICAVPVILFFIFFMIVFIRHIRYLCTNMTTLQELKMEREHDEENPYDLGCWNNCSETMGPKACCFLWFIPIPLPRMNAGIFWHRNDEEISDDVAAEVKRRAVVYARDDSESETNQNSEYSTSAPLQINELIQKQASQKKQILTIKQPQQAQQTQQKQQQPTNTSPLSQTKSDYSESDEIPETYYSSESEKEPVKGIPQKPQKYPIYPPKEIQQQKEEEREQESPKQKQQQKQQQSPQKKQQEAQASRYSSRLHFVGVNTNELLEDTATSTNAWDEYRKPKMRRYDPQRDAGKKVYVKVKLPRKQAEERERLKAEGKDYHTVTLSPRSTKSTIDRMPSAPSTLDGRPSPPASPSKKEKKLKFPEPKSDRKQSPTKQQQTHTERPSSNFEDKDDFNFQLPPPRIQQPQRTRTRNPNRLPSPPSYV